MKQETKKKLTYKVVCDFNDNDFHTDQYDTARDIFNEYREEYGDGIRLYEAETPEEDDESPEWEIIDWHDKDEEPKDESKEVKEGGEDWEVKPFRTVTGLKYSIVSHYYVIAKCDKEEDAILLAQSNAMLKLIQWISRVTNNPEIGIKCDAMIKKANPKK